MRTIKFRGKYKYGNTHNWVYGDLITCRSDGEFSILNDRCLSAHGYIIQKETAGQFTGLYDSIGGEVYEGDCIGSDEHYFGVVEHHEGYFTVRHPKDEMRQALQTILRVKNVRVLDNIHDTPNFIFKNKER